VLPAPGRPPLRSHGRALPEDAVAEAVAAACEVAARDPGYFAGVAHFVNFVRLVAARLETEDFRRGRRRVVQPLRGDELRDRRPHLTDEGLPEEAKTELWECVRRLAPRERAAVEFYYARGLRDFEVGLLLFEGKGTRNALNLRAYRLRHQALEHLREMLGREEFPVGA
jgi:DNA-directed RNA polymerase specialized sigma24 family protein